MSPYSTATKERTEIFCQLIGVRRVPFRLKVHRPALKRTVQGVTLHINGQKKNTEVACGSTDSWKSGDGLLLLKPNE